MPLFDDSTARDLNLAPVSDEPAESSAETQHGEHGPNPENTPNPERPGPGPIRVDKQPMTTEDFATALETFTPEPELTASEERVLKGTVLKITPSHVVVDVGAKSEGMVPIAEVQDGDGNVEVKPGDEIDVMVEKGETEEGYINLSHQKARHLRAWDDIEKAYNEKTPIKAKVVDRIKGGLTVDIHGARAFLPGSQVDLRPVRNLEGLKNDTFDVQVIKLNKKRGNIVVSRKQLLEQEQTEKRSHTMEHLSEGAVLT